MTCSGLITWHACILLLSWVGQKIPCPGFGYCNVFFYLYKDKNKRSGDFPVPQTTGKTIRNLDCLMTVHDPRGNLLVTPSACYWLCRHASWCMMASIHVLFVQLVSCILLNYRKKNLWRTRKACSTFKLETPNSREMFGWGDFGKHYSLPSFKNWTVDCTWTC